MSSESDYIHSESSSDSDDISGISETESESESSDYEVKSTELTSHELYNARNIVNFVHKNSLSDTLRNCILSNQSYLEREGYLPIDPSYFDSNENGRTLVIREIVNELKDKDFGIDEKHVVRYVLQMMDIVIYGLYTRRSKSGLVRIDELVHSIPNKKWYGGACFIASRVPRNVWQNVIKRAVVLTPHLKKTSRILKKKRRRII